MSYESVLISIHAPQWGATCGRPPMTSRRQFQSTHPSGVRLHLVVLGCHASKFQSTHPSGVRHAGSRALRRTARFQSTHPSGVRHGIQTWPVTGVRISIHAPQWGATQGIHKKRQTVAISIHAPQWGATTTPDAGKSNTADFNPRTPVGCDYGTRYQTAYSLLFQSTHPSGVRQSTATWSIRPDTYFNPRTPVGCDLDVRNITRDDGLFQSTHPSGVRPGEYRDCRSWDVFQSTHPSGVRPAPSRHARQSDYFNPRTPVGCDTMR